MSAPGGTVKVARDGAVAILTLSYPERRNAFSLPLRAVLLKELQAALEDEACRVIVLTGEGANFCSGGDITSFDGVTPVSGRARMQRVHAIVRLVVRGEKPVIAAIEGHAAGAGLCLAAACDMVVAARDARLSCTFNKIGLFPDFGGAWSLPLRMGIGKAKMLMMSGRVLDGEAGERQGLVDLLAEPGQALTAALGLAHDVAATAPLSNGLLKAVLARGPSSLEEVLAAEADAQGVLYGSEDFQEGRSAFLEKRSPTFTGR
ncbi:MAG: enoyl-CoA hydratase [Phenylobacterium sp.]|nr:enoyl-CoA hydratase [Phenylobacterium sp.]